MYDSKAGGHGVILLRILVYKEDNQDGDSKLKLEKEESWLPFSFCLFLEINPLRAGLRLIGIRHC